MCRDKALTYLNGFGYNVVRVPQEGLDPLALIGRHGDAVARLGGLHDFVDSLRDEPVVEVGLRAAALEGKQTGKLSFDAGLSILEGFVSAMGGRLGVSGGLVRSSSLQFSFPEVLIDRATPAAIGEYLVGATLRHNPLWQPYLSGKGTLTIVTEVIKCRRFTLTLDSSSSGSEAVDLPELQKLVSGKVSVSHGGGSGATLSFAGDTLLTFGFKCFKLEYGRDGFQFEGIRASHDTAFALSPDGGAPDGTLDPAHLFEESDLLSLDPRA